MKNVKEIEIEIKGKEWEKDLDKAFKKKLPELKVPGFRKGSIPKEVYLKKAGIESLFMDASDIAIEDAYKKALDKDVNPVVQPSVEIVSVSKDSVKFKFTIITRPEIKLGAYTKLGIKKEEIKVSKKEIDEEIEKLRDNMAEILNKENGAVEKGNIAIIDFDGVVDGKKLDGGSGKDYSLEIGSNTFIPGFEDELVGMSIGDTKKINLKFPEDYVENLKGKDVTFTVTIKGIKERVVPALGKDFYEDLAIDGVDSKESLEEYIKSELSEKKNDEVENKYVDELLHKATDNMEVEINNEIIDEEVHHMIHQYEDELKYQGASLQQYLAMTKTKMEDLENMMKPQAIARIKTRFLLEEIVDKENIKASAAEIKEEVKNNAAKYGMKDEEFLDAMGGNDAIAYDIKMKKAVEIIKEA